MHDKPFISLLAFALAGLLSQDVLALPFDKPGGIIHLPIKRVEQRRNDVHPQIRHQQYVNRAYKRLARMTGRAEPTNIELRNNLIRTIEFLERSQPEILSRYNHGPPYNKRQQSNVTVVTPANPPSANNSLGLDIEGTDDNFLCTIQTGTPPRDFKVVVDSGSADLWLVSENCQVNDTETCGNHNFLGNQSSSTFVDTGKPWKIEYVTGDVAGTIVTDNISIAGLSLPNHKFGVASHETSDLVSVAFDGILGTAQSTLSVQGNLTLVEALAKKNLIAGPITSYKIPRLADGKNDGEITFGGLNPTKFDPTTLVTLDNVSPKGYWEASMGDVSVFGQSLGIKNRTAVFDTGTKVILAPISDAKAVHSKIPGSRPFKGHERAFMIPCNTTASVALTFGGTMFTIDSRDLGITPIHPTLSRGECVSSIVGADGDAEKVLGRTEWLLGDVFLKNAYFSHDVSTNKIKLAKLV